MNSRKKRMLKIAIPVVLGLLIISVVSVMFTGKYYKGKYNPQLEYMQIALASTQAELSKYSVLKQTYVLAKDKSAGERINGEDLVAVEVPESFAPMSILDKSKLVGKILRIDAKANTMLLAGMLYMDGPIQPTDRRVEINYVSLPLRLKVTDIIDVNIVFPNGETYTVLSKKRLEALDPTTHTIYLRVNHEEELLLHSAFVDAHNLRAELYASQYVEPEVQAAMARTYIPNNDVGRQLSFSIYVDNKDRYSENSILRNALEERLDALEDNARELRVRAVLPAGSAVSQQGRLLGATVVPNNSVDNLDNPQDTGGISSDSTLDLNPIYSEEEVIDEQVYEEELDMYDDVGPYIDVVDDIPDEEE